MKLTQFDQTDKGAVLSFSGATPDEVGREVGSFLRSSGFDQEEGTETNGVWGAGSKAKRVLGGAFAKRKKYQVSVEGSEPVTATISSTMTGWSGGAIGAVKEKKQRKELADQMRQHFESRF